MWIFSYTVCMDQQHDETEDLVDITRENFKEAEGCSSAAEPMQPLGKRPDAIQYFSVHCNILLLVLGLNPEARTVSCKNRLIFQA